MASPILGVLLAGAVTESMGIETTPALPGMAAQAASIPVLLTQTKLRRLQ
jgi:hypothetical protein